MGLTNHQLTILLKLIENNGFYVSSENLALLTGLSIKTIHQEIKELKPIASEKYGIVIDAKKTKGFSARLLTSNVNEELFDINNIVYNANIPYSKSEDRVHYVIQRLLTCNNSLRIEDLASELYVSRYTLTEDLKFVKAFLKNYDLKLLRVSNRGISIEGKEHNKRICIINEYSLLPKMVDYYECKDFIELFKIDKNEEQSLRKIVEYYLKQNAKYMISIKALNKAIYAIIISLHRNQEGVYLSYKGSEEEMYRMQTTHSYKLVDSIIDEYSQKYNHYFTKNDKVFLSIILVGFRNFLSYDEVFVKSFYEEGFFVAQDILNYLVQQIGIVEFRDNGELLKLLAGHCIPMLIRIKHNLVNDSIPGYLTHKKHFLSTELSVIAFEYIKKYTKANVINANEINYMAFVFVFALAAVPERLNYGKRFVVVSSMGRDVAYLMMQAVLKQYDQFVRSITAITQYQINTIDKKDYDYIITDMDDSYFKKTKIPVIRYNFESLTEMNYAFNAEYHRLNEKCDELHKIIIKKQFKANINAKNKEDVFKVIEKLASAKCSSENILTKLQKREEICTIERSNNIAFTIVRDCGNEESFMTTVILKKPIIWFRETVQIVIVFFLGNNPYDLLKIRNEFEQFINNPDAIVSILKNPTYENLINELDKHILMEVPNQ